MKVTAIMPARHVNLVAPLGGCIDPDAGIHSGLTLENVLSSAVMPPRQRGFVTSRLSSFGRDGATRKAARLTELRFSTSRPPIVLENALSGLSLVQEHGMAKTHGLSGTLTYARWKSMNQRCNDPNAINYPEYGGSGIKVCTRWEEFPAFLVDMGECPTPAHTLDRLRNSEGYAPGNCRWATRIEQSNNRTSNRILVWRGESKTVSEWARVIGIPAKTLWNRVQAGWDLDRALTRGSHETGPLLTYRGRTLHLAEWARQLGVNYDLLSRRLHAGWDIERALSQPSNRARKGAPA